MENVSTIFHLTRNYIVIGKLNYANATSEAYEITLSPTLSLSLSLSLEISRKIVYTNDFIRSISFACLVTRETINNVNVTEAHLFYTLF